MLYGTSFLAERYAGIREFLEAGPAATAAQSPGPGGSPPIAAPLKQANGSAPKAALAGATRSMSTDSDDSSSMAASAAAAAAALAEGAVTLSRQQILADECADFAAPTQACCIQAPLAPVPMDASMPQAANSTFI